MPPCARGVEGGALIIRVQLKNIFTSIQENSSTVKSERITSWRFKHLLQTYPLFTFQLTNDGVWPRLHNYP